MENKNSLNWLYITLPIALGLIFGGYFIGQTMYNAKVALNTAIVRGLAERKVKANRADWKISYTVTGKSRSELPKLYKASEKNQAIILEHLQAGGFAGNEIEIGVVEYFPQEFRDDQQRLVEKKHLLTGRIKVKTSKVDLVSKVRAQMGKLIAEGIDISNHSPTYRFTELNKIKPEMLREATKNARIAAKEFAKNAAVSVGGIRSARQGNFTIKDSGEDYGDTKRIEKDIRVVTKIEFYLN